MQNIEQGPKLKCKKKNEKTHTHKSILKKDPNDKAGKGKGKHLLNSPHPATICFAGYNTHAGRHTQSSHGRPRGSPGK